MQDFTNKIGQELGILFYNRENEAPITEKKLKEYIDMTLETFPVLISNNEIPIDRLLLYTSLSEGLQQFINDQWGWVVSTLNYYDVDKKLITQLGDMVGAYE